MKKEFYIDNRKALEKELKNRSLAVFFCGDDVGKMLSSKLEAPTPCSLYGLESAV